MSIHERIKARRAELGLTLEDVAKSLNVSRSTVLRYETKAIENMGIDKLEALAKVLKVDPAYLMGWMGPVPKSSEEAAVMVKREAAEAAEYLNRLSPEDLELAIGVLRRISSRTAESSTAPWEDGKK